MGLALVVRGGMAALAVLHLWWGAWARVWPEHFFVTFPGLGHHWTAAYPPYNQHLVADLGATFLTLGLLLALGAALDSSDVRLVVLAGVVTFSALHLGFHSVERATMTWIDYALSLGVLLAGVAVPVALLAAEWRLRRRAGRRTDR